MNSAAYYVPCKGRLANGFSIWILGTQGLLAVGLAVDFVVAARDRTVRMAGSGSAARSVPDQWRQAHPPGAPQTPEGAKFAEPFEDLLPLAGAAKTESCSVCLALSHLGQVTRVLWFITIRS